MRGRVIIATAALGALAVAGCGSKQQRYQRLGGTAARAVLATIGIEGPITGPVAVLGTEQLHFAQLAVAMDNKANKTKITLVQGDTQLQPCAGDDRDPAVHLELEDRGGGRPGRQPGGRGRRPAVRPGRHGRSSPGRRPPRR